MDLSLAAGNLLSPMVLAFVLGLSATLLKSDLRFPNELYTTLSIYLLLAIGLKGGYKLSIVPASEFLKPAFFAFLLGVTIPFIAYSVLRRITSLSVYDCAALAAHYGSVSAVTFAGAQSFQDSLFAVAGRAIAIGESGLQIQEGFYEGFLPGLLAIMEVPAIVVGVFLAKIAIKRQTPQSPDVKDKVGPLSESSTKQVYLNLFRELLAGKGSILLLGGLAIGYIGGKSGWEQVSAVFEVPFKGILMLFLLEAGLVSGRRISDFKLLGFTLIAFAIVFPVFIAFFSIAIGAWSGLSPGGAVIFGTLASSASYIAAPAACRVAIPEADPSVYLTLSLAITFPWNITFGIPLYHNFGLFIFSHFL